ncbi:MAG: hypothetical protein LBF59_10525 [Prevotellaceae bacterium]|nr:hypothetical protein [Prevotellaceae bacterium]
MSAGCGRPSGSARQCQRGADDRREALDNVSREQTTSGNVRQCQQVADDRREAFDNVTGCGRSSGKASGNIEAVKKV